MTTKAAGENSPEVNIPFELQSLAAARKYQIWLRDISLPFMGDRILELGSGIGNISQHLPVRERLILSDVDPYFVDFLKSRAWVEKSNKLSVFLLPDLNEASLAAENLDTIVSFNVLEHIEDDVALLRDAINILARSEAKGPKRIVSLVPAHQWAYSSIDRQFGHFRRYSDHLFRESLTKAGAEILNSQNYKSRYVNLPALFAWWLKGRLLGDNSIGIGGIKAFEILCPLIRPLDDFIHSTLRLPLGNSLLTVYQVNSV